MSRVYKPLDVLNLVLGISGCPESLLSQISGCPESLELVGVLNLCLELVGVLNLCLELVGVLNLCCLKLVGVLNRLFRSTWELVGILNLWELVGVLNLCLYDYKEKVCLVCINHWMS